MTRTRNLLRASSLAALTLLAACKIQSYESIRAASDSAQTAGPDTLAPGTVLELIPPGGEPIRLSMAQLRGLTRTEVVGTARRSGRTETTGRWTGVTFRELLSLAGVPQLSGIEGEFLHHYALVHAADRSYAVFSLAELDAAISNNPVILAYSADGGELAPEDGQLRVISPRDNGPTRWVRNVIRVSIHNAEVPR